ncbi:MAG: class II fructose-1,6-bisphosphate aldolase [Candidatus Enteromonas sp.]|nr:class II fructose-1,6-bisphosphate aldolase [Candidatus Enteromonas sp.]
MLVNATRILKEAHAGHYAVGQFNINNLEWTKAILLEAEALKSPVILGVSEGAAKYMGGFEVVAAMVRAMDKSLGITVPVVLHLDHGSYEGCLKCIEAGFTSIMFDGSHFPFEQNIAKTKELIKIAHDKGLSIEAEVGAIGGTEDGITADGEVADPKECAEIAALGVDFLAAGIGNIHGLYPKDWKGLNIEALKAIQEATGGIPLVLHGGTGIPDNQIRDAIAHGMSKINVNTDCQLVFAEATRDYCLAGKADPTSENKEKGYDPRKLLKPGFQAIQKKVQEKCDLFGSTGKAN